MITSRNFISIDRNLFNYFKGNYDLLVQLVDYIEAYNLFLSQDKLRGDGSFYASNNKTSERLGFSHVKVIKQKKQLEDLGFIITDTRDGITYITLNKDKITKIQNENYNIAKIEDFKEDKEEKHTEPEIEEKPKPIKQKNNELIEIQKNYIKENWNNIAEKYNLPMVSLVNEERIKKLKNICKYVGITEHGFFQKLDDIIANSQFLQGNNSNGWKCNLNFFLQKSSIIKALEGNYENSKNNKPKLSFKEEEALRKRAFISELFKDKVKQIEM